MKLRKPYVLLGGIALLALAAPTSFACPFCTALRPTLSEQREQSTVTLLAELEGDGKSASKPGDPQHFLIHQALRGADAAAGASELTTTAEFQGKSGALALLFGEGDAKTGLPKLAWTAAKVNETSLAYFAAAPTLRKPTAERLAYFLRFLQHSDPLIAEDAYQEFGHASVEEISKIAAQLPQDKFRAWLVDAKIPPARKGFFAVALGLATTDADRKANLALLEKLMTAEGSDFRAGFDGVLGGYLLLRGEEGLAAIGKRYFANPKAGEGDVRHAIAAVRFFYEYDRKLDREKFRAALRPLLARKEFANAAILDLARWKDWSSTARVAALYDAADYPQPATREAVVAFLTASPESAAADRLATLRKRDPAGVASAELRLGKIPQAQ
jgi:hypothetical protein